MSKEFDRSLEDGAHALLARCAGAYEGTSRTWFQPGDPVDTSQAFGTLHTILGGRFLLHEYTGSMEGTPLEGEALIGFFLPVKRWQVAWIGSFHNGTRMMFSESGTNSDPQKPDVRGGYPAPPGPDWGWRTTIELPEADRLVITHFNISPEGEEVKAVEFDYRKVHEPGTY